jgi:phospholipid/cholesterol/gamma-HCH transport system substrate-binding protein
MLRTVMSYQVRVGLFVIAGLALLVTGVFLIGNTRELWDSKVGYRAAFQNVAGLKPGAPVRMGGLDIGTVISIDRAVTIGDTQIYVAMSVSKKDSARIRSNTVAHVVNKGLLGDKMIELSVGSPDAPQLNAQTLITTEEPADIFASASNLASATQETIERLRPLASALGDPRFGSDVQGSAASLRMLLDAAAHGHGLVHALFFDPETANRADEAMANLARSTERLDRTLADVEDLTSHVRSGPGVVHALFYDDKLSSDAEGTLAELHGALRAVREESGLAHSIVYGDGESRRALTNLGAITDDLRTIVSGIRQGKGTLGALLVDPTVYEDLKSAIGNVERNAVLRALVRYSIRADEQKVGPK